MVEVKWQKNHTGFIRHTDGTLHRLRNSHVGKKVDQIEVNSGEARAARIGSFAGIITKAVVASWVM